MGSWLRQPLPAAPALPAALRDDLRRLTLTLQQHEQDTIDACAALQSHLGEQGDGLLLALLDAMILDSEKHRRLLTVVEKMVNG